MENNLYYYKDIIEENYKNIIYNYPCLKKNINLKKTCFKQIIHFFYDKLKKIFLGNIDSTYTISMSSLSSKKNKEKDIENKVNPLFYNGKYYYLYSIESDFDPRSVNISVKNLVKFIEKNPNDNNINEAYTLLDNLDSMLEKKNYDVSNSFFTMRQYRVAIFYFEDFLKNYPYSNYIEDVLYKICMCNYNLNQKKYFYSYYNKYIKQFPKSNNVINLKKILHNIKK
ncbi:outer membrane protein assembly factor BamD [Blattabacterium cuenoti]|uniref:hypothetical protein n=1 Tax=Blattabacterium cuenoti TaxID=1653831 RepID=UPI00163C954B|nr:hypothetical protein [Blattabacterium cuenoti]